MSVEPASGGSVGGFLASLGDSFKAHVDERLKSPFAGAFLIAWIAVNWQSILIVIFSEKTIEERISVVAGLHSGWEVLVWRPLLLAICIAVAFYAFSAAFLVVAEVYAFVKGWIEQRFDSIRWVSPTDYMRAKKKNLDQTRALQELAADNLSELNKEKERANSLAAEVLAVQEKVSALNSERATLLNEHQGLLKRLDEIIAGNRELEKKLQSVRDGRERMIAVASDVESLLDLVRSDLERNRVTTDPQAWNRYLGMQNTIRALLSEIKAGSPIL